MDQLLINGEPYDRMYTGSGHRIEITASRGSQSWALMFKDGKFFEGFIHTGSFVEHPEGFSTVNFVTDDRGWWEVSEESAQKTLAGSLHDDGFEFPQPNAEALLKDMKGDTTPPEVIQTAVQAWNKAQGDA